ncbi:MAG: CoA transferase, partial [Candidatus Tectomicrobia bacterium]|nr:CoA transferase [Candidatus Tectomicrobia bacterium]
LTPGRVRWGGPRLGQHNQEVYGDLLGMALPERERLQEAGII